MQQTALFHDSIFDALGADVAALGGVKKVAGMLWPALDATVAAQRLRGGLNPEHAQKLCPQEVMAIKRLAREQGSFATINYEAQALAYRIDLIEPEDELARIERENNEMLKAITRRLERADQIRNRTSLKVAK